MKGVHQDRYRDDAMEADVVITQRKNKKIIINKIKKDKTEANCN